MVIWRGYGILVVVFMGVCMVAAKAGAESLWGTPLPIEKRQLYELLGMWLAAGAVYGLHLAVTKLNPPRTVVDQQTGEELKLVSKHDLFFVPIKYWSIVLVALGVLFFVQ
ncbi:hypothetical protein [Hydrogenophaga sp.]|uniref:hypothetical protein n=1 Tax=Hydrogenophaga sp. TaxID=1904254 RepID=UPI00272916A8|nr:hypothetical protein [Hydrogenophaga sp.]MDO9438631.1 hypothetical protein [Hydrogenophaga sp.]